jgi:DNA-binding IclR family transcriptional regulator
MTEAEQSTSQGSQTLLRGLDLLDIVAKEGPLPLAALTQRVGLTRSTTHRLAAALIERRYLDLIPAGYVLGSKLLRMDVLARQQLTLPSVAREHIERLARETSDAVNLAVRQGQIVRYVDQVPGNRRVEVRSVIGETRPIRSTGLGKALILDDTPEQWRGLYRLEGLPTAGVVDEEEWMRRMANYAAGGVAFDLEENEDRIRCLAAPIRGPNGAIIGALSLSTIAQYMDDARMQSLIEPVKAVAEAISVDMGWTPEVGTGRAPR